MLKVVRFLFWFMELFILIWVSLIVVKWGLEFFDLSYDEVVGVFGVFLGF